jgi:hypothetical protein
LRDYRRSRGRVLLDFGATSRPEGKALSDFEIAGGFTRERMRAAPGDVPPAFAFPRALAG